MGVVGRRDLGGPGQRSSLVPWASSGGCIAYEEAVEQN